MMILLNGHSLTPADRFQPETMSLQLSERQSTASMTLGPEAPALNVGDWLQSETGPDGGTVWRVKTIDHQVDRRTRTVQLEHAINSLRDALMFGEVKPSDISGSSADPTARQAVEFILARQSDWTLGTFDYGSVSNPYGFNGDDLFSALETVSGSLEECIWEYGFSSYPFTLSIRQMAAEVTSEMRTDRNIRTLKRSIDRSRMYTRIYPIGKNNLHITGDYISKNEDLYGMIAHTETENSKGTDAELRAWAQERLDNHCEPSVTVTISGLDLSEATGEALDSFVIGRKCRIPLPEYGTTIVERVVKLAYQDVINTPEQVTVTLANELLDVATILRQQSAQSGRGGRNQSLNDEEDHAWIVDTTDRVVLVAEAVAGKDGDGPNWSRVSELTVDGNGIDARVTHAEGEIVDAWTEISMTDEKISAAVTAAGSTIYSAIEQTASSIRATIEDTEQGLYNEILNSASGTRQIIRSTTSRTWIQDKDPTTPAGGSHTPKDGDIWVESTHQGSWDGAEGFPWEHDEDFDWNQIQGAKVWGWANDKWELVSDQQQVVSYAEVVETAEHYLNLRIKGIVNDVGMIEVYISKLEQTAEELRSDIYQSTSQIYSFIDQTVSAINLGVGGRATTVMQKGQPSTIHGRAPVDNDVWIDTEEQETWDKALDFSWNDDYEIEWNKLRSDKIYVYKDGQWVLAMDGTVLAEDTDLQVTSSQIAMMARNIDTLDGYARENFAQLKVEASRISSSVLDKTNELGSRITQTATQIRSEVYASQSQVYSSITQTASSIRLEVANAISGVQSSITQTASSIRSEVSASQSRVYSAITQTASSIRLEVNNAISGVNSSITQTASQIRSEVAAGQSRVYSSITQTASSIRMDVNSAISNVHSAINVQANRISLVVEGTGANAKIKPASIVAAINNGESSVIISANHINLNGYVKATDITTNYLTTKLESASLIKAGGFQSTGTIYASGTITSGNDVQVTIGSANVSLLNAYTALQVVSAGNNTYKIQRRSFNTSEWQDVPGTFSRAVSSWGFAWGSGYSGMCTITANPQEQSTWVNISQGTSSWSGRTVTIPIMATDANAPGSPTKVYEASATYSLPKSSISLTRSSSSQTEPTTDTSVTGIVTNGWYVLTVSAAGTTKTFKLHVTV